jgi:hypothetical protein
MDSKSVVAFSRQAWSQLVDPSGVPTLFPGAPAPLSRVAEEASVVVVAGSGIPNSEPGCDIVRNDPADAPFIYNIDHYKVIENLPMHPMYGDVLCVAGVQRSQELDRYLQENVFMVGPYRLDHHHVTEIPSHIAHAVSFNRERGLSE